MTATKQKTQRKAAQKPQRRAKTATLEIKLVQESGAPDWKGRVRYRLDIRGCDIVPDMRVWARTPEQARKVLADYLLNEIDGCDEIFDECYEIQEET